MGQGTVSPSLQRGWDAKHGHGDTAWATKHARCSSSICRGRALDARHHEAGSPGWLMVAPGITTPG